MLPRGEAAPAPKARILDTLQTVLEDDEIAEEFGRKLIQSPQRVFDAEWVSSQLGLFDGLGYQPPAAIADPDEPNPPRAPVEQLGFVFSPDGVQMHFDEWHRRQVAELELFRSRFPRGKIRKSLGKKARRGRDCGRIVRNKVCALCSGVEAKETAASQCECRTCPASARADALEVRRKLYAAARASPYERRGLRLFAYTLTVRRPEWTTIERLRVDRKRVLDGWRAGRRILARYGLAWAHANIEVSQGGVVHCHVMARHRYVHGKAFDKLRDAMLAAIGGGTTQCKVQAVKNSKKAVKEVAKYVCKGVAMNNRSARQTHPRLAAMIECAFHGLPTSIVYGELPLPPEKEEPEWHCPFCGNDEFRYRYIDRRTNQIIENERGPP